MIGSDDDAGYHVAFDYTATTTGAYRLRVGFFESVITGALTVTRRESSRPRGTTRPDS